MSSAHRLPTPSLPPMRIGGCPALAEMESEGGLSFGVMPCAKDQGHRPRVHEGRSMEGDVRIGFWWDSRESQVLDSVDGYSEPTE